MASMINLLFDLVFLLSSVIGYYLSFFTALDFDYSISILFGLCLLSILFYFIFSKLSKKRQLLLIILLLIPVIVYFTSLINGSKQLAMEIFLRYKLKDKKFNVPYITYEESAFDAMITIFLINIPITVSLSHYYAKKKQFLLHYLPAIILLWIPLLYQLIPDYLYFSMFLIPLFVQYLCHYQRANSYVIKGIVTALLVMICSLMILSYNEDHDYTRLFSFDSLQNTINNAGRSVNSQKAISEIKDLSKVGSISPTHSIKLYIDSKENLGTFKIKGMVYDEFNQDTWSHREIDDDYLNSTTRRLLNLNQEHAPYSMQIYTTMNLRCTLYEPYFTTSKENGSYTYIIYNQIYENDYGDVGEMYTNCIWNYCQKYYDLYTSVPEVYASILDETLNEAGILEADDPYEKAVKIRNYFRKEFTYTYTPEAVSEDSTFVESFLESKKGYCVHFATTAALLLRESGVMARYVEGYQVIEYNQKNRRYAIYDSDAHAWIEYFDPNVGWLPFEVTSIYDIESSVSAYHPVSYEPDPEASDESETETNPNEEIIVPVETDSSHRSDTAVTAADSDRNFIPIQYIMITGMILILFIIRLYRIHRFRKYAKQGNNQYALFLYHQLDNLKINVPAGIHDLILKAMYSNTELSEEELINIESFYFNTLLNYSILKKGLVYYYYYIRRKKK